MTLNNLYNKLENIRKDRGAVAVALIDPDKKHSKKIPKMVELINNADFDVGFINNELKLIGNKSLTNEIIDTLVLARKTLNTRTANLDYLCRRF